jgi:hypothetical protein
MIEWDQIPSDTVRNVCIMISISKVGDKNLDLDNQLFSFHAIL